ncbi:MAG: RNA-binding S4 domain-containing protein [Paludibacteraceae bacterium]|nr:RNA-binding S4 domain-containing protein [Prevotellaceae bacterium]
MAEKKEEVRIDKWMWAVRLFKTRSLAADACKKGKVRMSGSSVKPSRNVKIGDVVQIKRPPIVYSFKVLALSENRMGAKLVPDFMENVTTPDQMELLEMGRFSGSGIRDRGTGRPTKKERRDLDIYVAPSYASDGDFGFDFDFSDDDDLDDADL